ncbi:MAG TPA: hypothetical protein PLJ27_25240 [Polyangiaceae bacterium]|nr:MAG: hypothetical protein BWY17_01444 [Deltaproteobacteria bacterium ADurb.Bin207]HNS96258.1 hypothetical protein [Polyangiaceae bacterium]HNZ20798.1 hypothetical protein [Polyangiaceae bacterium]HOD22670.1 hypothetical protein [Polyangiaceae bacterium]HOE48228.1 hypothetical protein [Polyangiaceae bacterium]
MTRVATLLMSIGLLSLGTTGCQDISRFGTGPGQSYCGRIVPGGFVREGFSPGVTMRVHLDADHLYDAPGDVATDDGLFADAPLRPIPQLAHDSLSTLNFGEGRVRNLLYGAQPTQGAVAYVILSLLDNEDVEARVLRGAPPTDIEAVPVGWFGPELFGVFPLTRQSNSCGF